MAASASDSVIGARGRGPVRFEARRALFERGKPALQSVDVRVLALDTPIPNPDDIDALLRLEDASGYSLVVQRWHSRVR